MTDHHDPFGPGQPSSAASEHLPLGATATDPAFSRRQSRVALILSVVPLLVTQVAAITLSVLVLAERDRHDRQRPLAGAALGISTVWIVAMVVALLVLSFAGDDGPDDERPRLGATWNEDGTLDRSGRARLDQVRVGDCFDPDGPVDAVTGTPDGVLLRACDAAHDNEAYHAFVLADGPYPAQEELLRRARGGCQAAFGGWVGIAYEDSALLYDFFVPTESGWPADRVVTCYITDLGGSAPATTQGSAR
ncbi:septum formation family protein [Aeromicrobium sp. Leaf350]|uniref:septum formation family protein n=1 Tax=Aeromicrobium sp. Leaf350 TaxID=2876565 RepID=UPI001E3D63C3|nr:septum formation family protein [Aeromicrobium sp. Leaf350]